MSFLELHLVVWGVAFLTHFLTDFSTEVSHDVAFGAVFGYKVTFFDSVWDFLDLNGVFGSIVVIRVRKFDFVFDDSVFGDGITYFAVTAFHSLADLLGTHLLLAYEATYWFTISSLLFIRFFVFFIVFGLFVALFFRLFSFIS